MKRTQQLNPDAFRKSWRHCRTAVPSALAISSVILLSACEKTDETVTLYQNADDCSRANPGMVEQCNRSWQQAKKEAVKTAPKYGSRADCVAEFGEGQCTSVASNTNGQTVQTQQQSGSLWMPLLAGYMMGKVMGGGFAQQPLFTSGAANSPMNGKFVDASGRNYGSATYGRTMQVNKRALAPNPPTTNTITRGGFGQSVTKQFNSMGG